MGSSESDICSAAVIAMLYAISWYIELHYNGTQLSWVPLECSSIYHDITWLTVCGFVDYNHTTCGWCHEPVQIIHVLAVNYLFNLGKQCMWCEIKEFRFVRKEVCLGSNSKFYTDIHFWVMFCACIIQNIKNQQKIIFWESKQPIS